MLVSHQTLMTQKRPVHIRLGNSCQELVNPAGVIDCTSLEHAENAKKTEDSEVFQTRLGDETSCALTDAGTLAQMLGGECNIPDSA